MLGPSSQGTSRARRCGPCRAVFPHLSKIAKSYADKGLVVVGISVEADSPQLDAFVARQQMDYTVAVSEQCDPQMALTTCRAGSAQCQKAKTHVLTREVANPHVLPLSQNWCVCGACWGRHVLPAPGCSTYCSITTQGRRCADVGS